MRGNPGGLLHWGGLGGCRPPPSLTHCSFLGQRSREEQAAGKDGQQSSLSTDGVFSMEENSLYSSRGKGRHREVGKVQWSWVCSHRRQSMSRSISSPPLPEAPWPVLCQGAAPAMATCRRRGEKSPPEIASSCSAVWQGWVSLRYRAAPVRPEPLSPYRPDAASPLPRLRGVTSPTAPLCGGRCSSALAARSSAPCTYQMPPSFVPSRLGAGVQGDSEGHRAL